MPYSRMFPLEKSFVDNLQGRIIVPQWYQELSPWEKGLVNRYQEDIVAGNHVLPTQTRNQGIPGARNGFVFFGGVIPPAEVNVRQNLDLVQKSSHTGSIATAPKHGHPDEIARITEQNMRQLRESHGGTTQISFNLLNNNNSVVDALSDTGLAKALMHGAVSETMIVKRTMAAAEATKNACSKVPINSKRVLEGREAPASAIILDNITAQLQGALGAENLLQYLKGESDDYNLAFVYIQALANHNPANFIFLKAVLDLKKAHGESSYQDSNPNLVIANCLGHL